MVLAQDRPVPGANVFSETRMWICGAHGAEDKEAGILEERVLENIHRNPTRKPGSIWTSWPGTASARCVDCVIVFALIFTIICRHAALLDHGQQWQKKVKIRGHVITVAATAT